MIKDRDKFLSFWFTLIEMEERVFSLNGYQAVYDFKNSKKKKSCAGTKGEGFYEVRLEVEYLQPIYISEGSVYLHVMKLGGVMISTG
jgi:hypothetical protein